MGFKTFWWGLHAVFPKELTTLLNVELVEGRGKRAGNDLIY